MEWVRRLRAQYLVARNRWTEAATIYRDVLRSEPVHAPGLYVVLADCRARGHIDEAIAIATRALAVDDVQFVALQTLAWAYVTKGDHASARPVVAKAVELFDRQRLGAPSSALRGIDRVLDLAQLRRRRSLRIRSNVDKRVADSLLSWRRWAQEYLASRN